MAALKTSQNQEKKGDDFWRGFFFVLLLGWLFLLIFGAIYKNYQTYFFAKHWKELSAILLLVLFVEAFALFQKKE